MRAAIAWLVPSVIAACAGALVTGVLEGRGDGWRRVIMAGLLAIDAIPLLVIGALLTRAVIAAWQPATLLDGMREDRGAMPRLAAWVGVAWLGVLVLSWAMFQGTWLLASWTAFKPTSYGFLAPIIAVLALLATAALSRPCADLLEAIARRIDRRWQRRFAGTLLRPRTIAIATIVATAVVSIVIWLLVLRHRAPWLDLRFLLAPGAGVVVTIAMHFGWRAIHDPRARGGVGGVLSVLAIASIVTAIHAVGARPAAALAIWAEQPVGRIVIEQLFDVEDLRAGLPASTFQLPTQPGVTGATHPDLVLITLGGVRADRTPPYGGPGAMPALRDLAHRGVAIRATYAPTSAPARALPSLMTGFDPRRLRGVGTRGAGDVPIRLDPRHVGLAEYLRAGGYDTAAFVGTELDRSWTRGFDTVTVESDPHRLGYRAREWIVAHDRSASTRPMFVWVHAMAPLISTAPLAPLPSLELRRAAYDAALPAIDETLADTIRAFGSRPAPRAPIVMVTADRGQELGEHGAPYRNDDVYDNQIHVPWIVAGPGIRPQIANTTASTLDVVPTLLEFAGFTPPNLDGRSLARPLAQQIWHATSRPSGVAFATAGFGTGPHASCAIRGQWKLIDNGAGLELYDLETDPGELSNVAGDNVFIVEQMRPLLAAHDKREADTAPF